MYRLISKSLNKVGSRYMATAAATSSGDAMVLNFCTPHAAIYANKVVSQVGIPGESGEYAITVGHSPVISQLQPGIVTVTHTGGESEKFFVSGGFALTHANNITDVSVTEAVPLSDLDENAIKTGLAEAQKAASTGADGSPEKTAAQVEVNVYSSLARAIGISI